MSKPIYCSECGMKLNVTLKALKGYGRIINLVDPHVCAEVPMELDLTPTEVPVTYEGERKFVQNLNNLTQSVMGQVSTADLRDRRPDEQVKSTAPMNILEHMKHAVNSAPANPVDKDPGDSGEE